MLTSKVTPAGALGLAGLLVILIANARPLGYSGGHPVSAYHSFFPLRSPDSWEVLEFIVLPIVVAAGLALIATERTRRLGAGLLVGAGMEGYAAGLSSWAITIAVVPKSFGPRGGGLWFLIGCCAVGAAGLLVHARAGGTSAGRGVRWPVRALAALGALGLLLGATVPVDSGGTDGKSVAMVHFFDGYKWYALEPVLVALVVAGAALLGSRLEPWLAGGLFLAIGTLSLANFAGWIATYATGNDAVSGIGAGSYLGIAGGIAVAAAGAAALVLRPARIADPARAVPTRGLDGSSHTTRYLCAAAHLDQAFADKVIREIVDERYRALAPSPDVNLPLVLRHCLAARERTRVRDLVLAALAVPLIVLIGYSHSKSGLAAFAIIVAVVIAAATEQWVSRYRIAARRLRPGAGDGLELDLTADDEERLADAVAAASANVTIYSGYRPFVGSGYDAGGWSFAINVARGRKEGEQILATKPFEVEELYERVADSVRRLGLEGLTVDDQLYVDGRDIRDDERFITDRFGRPSGRIDDAELARFLRHPEQAIRHYRCIQVSGWRGEIVLSIFLHFAHVGQSLFAEARYFLLAPLKEEYHEIDTLQERPTFSQRMSFAVRSIPHAALALLLAPFHLAKRAFDGLRAWSSRREARKLIKTNPLFDYGATTSVRELAQSDRYRRYFQQVDREMYSKIVEREILDAFVAFLREKDIDTSDFEDRQATILNYGVMMSGGSLKAESLAVGEQAKAGVGERAKAMAAGVTKRGSSGSAPESS